MTGGQVRKVTDKIVSATCWCEAQTVRIPVDWVGVKTRSCGKRGCRAPRPRIVVVDGASE